MASFERSTINLPFRTAAAFGVACACFVVIALRLWYLQILNGDYFRARSENNRLRTVYLPPPRGLIYDREGRILAGNRPEFNIELVTEDSPDPRATVERLATILDLDPNTLVAQLGGQKRRRRFEPKLLVRDASRDMIARVVARRYELPGVVINVNPARDYLHGDLAAHVLGYIREITSRQLDLPGFSSYRSGDMVGHYGIESQWEMDLHGERGIQRVVVNATGSKIGESSFEPEVPGRNITLTLDLDVQREADTALQKLRGGVIALDPNNGEIVALSSAPRFDPNMFTHEIPSDTWRELVTGAERKLSNRVVQGGYPPGSVFKMIMAVAGLSENVMPIGERVFCPGYYVMGARKFKCHKHEGHGWVDLNDAMAMSCDVYFYTMGQRLGVDRIHDYASRFGLGSKTGLKLAEENAGLVPSSEWKQRRFGQRWYPGETPSVAIGQGALVTTPLQLARAMAAVVNGGFLVTPHLVREIADTERHFHEEFTGERGEIDVDPQILRQVKRALLTVVQNERGTGRKAQVDKSFNVLVGGKTGTAQVVSLEQGARHKHLQDHAWFVGFAPEEKPEIVVAALIENGGHGGTAAAPAVRQVMESFFKKRRGAAVAAPGNAESGARRGSP